MPGWSNASNKFGPSKFIVGPVLGDGVNYTSIQTAINDAFASLGANQHADVYIRPGLPGVSYLEDLVLPGSVNLIGASMSGEPDPTAIASVRITGDITINGNASTICSGIYFITSGAINGTNFSCFDPGGGTASLKLINCYLDSTGGNNVELGSAAGSGVVEAQDCTFSASTNNVRIPPTSIGINRYQIYSSELLSTGDGNFFVDIGTSIGSVIQCTMFASGNANFTFDANSTGSILEIFNSRLQSPGVANIIFQAAATVSSYNNTFDPMGNSEYILGPGNYNYADDHIIGGKLSSGIDNAAVQTIAGWRPWAQSDVNGTTVVRGTCAFDSAQFTVTEGFVQSNFSGLFPWVEQNASVIVNPNQGNFSVAAITLTLPAQVQPIGTTCKFKVVTNDQLIIAGNPGDVLQLGNQSGTTLTNTSSGDAIELTHYDLGIWIANASIGNWIVT